MMRASVSSPILLAGCLATLASISGCSSSDTGGDPNNVFNQAGNSNPGAGSGNATAGTGPGSNNGGATAGGAGNMSGAGPGGGAAGTSTGGQSGGSGGMSPVGDDVTKVVPSMGCGKAFAGASGQVVTIPTKGMKDANCADKINGKARCGIWGQAGSTWVNDNEVPCPGNDCTQPVMREYIVYLPQGYDMTKAYPLVFEGPGCGGQAKDIYPLPDIANQAIRVGLRPPPNYVGHGTNENQGCFDDKEGDDSVDWVFYENVYDALNAGVCFDRNRVFSAGNSSGAWFSNEVACKYAGDPMRPVRAPMPNTGGLPAEPQFQPTCSNKPMAGMWVHATGDITNPFTGNKFAIARAMKVNGCTGSMDYDAAVQANQIKNFPIGGGRPDDTCKLIDATCPALYPLVVCALAGVNHDSHDETVNPGFATFVKHFSMGTFITQ